MKLFGKLFGTPDRTAAAPETSPSRPGMLRRLHSGLAKSSRVLGNGITDIFTKRRLDENTLAELEETLIAADFGINTAADIARALGQGRYDREIAASEIRKILAAVIEKKLSPVEQALNFDVSTRPFVILMVGVNGSGKTTTIGKLGAIARRQGLNVMLAACDTFRAAAIDQLRIWSERIGASFISGDPGADSAGLAYDAFVAAREENADILLIDTAGRLHNKANLMSELSKIIRVLKKIDPNAPHAVVLTLDATTGQNSLNQVEEFTKIAGVTGIVMTKLDGTARGGILVAIAEKYRMPIYAIGIGETIDDLQPFDAHEFARAIVGIEESG